jgi:outer membrane receptor protein involved in Fe transport
VSQSGRVGFKGNFGIVNVGNSFSQSRTFGDAEQPCNPADGCTFEYGPLPVEPVPVSDDPIRSLYGGARVDLNFENGSVWANEGGWTRVENEIFITGIGRVQVNGANRPWFRSEYASDRFNEMGWYSGRRSSETDEDGNNQTALASGAQLRETSDIFHIEGQTNWSALQDRFQLVLGASNRWISIDTDGTLMEEKKEDTISSVFGQLEYAIHPMLTALVAARWDRFSVLEADENEVSPKAAIVFKPNSSNSVRVTFNRAFQVPNYSELFLRVPAGVPVDLTLLEAGLEQAISAQLGVPVDLPLNLSAQTPVLALGNDALRAEQLTGYEVGWKGSLANGRVFVTADVYFNTIEDFVTDLLPGVNPDFAYQLPAAFGAPPLNQVASIVQGTLLEQTGGAIATLPSGATALVVSYTNAGEVDENGVELGIAFLPAPNWEVSANYTYFNFDVKKAEEGDALLPNTPENKVNFGIVYDDPAGLTVGAKVHAQDAMDWAAGVFGGHVPGYATVDLNAGWQATPFARFNLFWVNVLDKQHYQLYGGSILGSRAIGGVTLTF